MNRYGQKRKPIPKGRRPQGPCGACGQPRGIQVHHLDWNPGNNAPSNLMVLCEWCHKEVGRLGQPLFDRLLKCVRVEPRLRAELRNSSDRWHAELPAHRQTHNSVITDDQGRLF